MKTIFTLVIGVFAFSSSVLAEEELADLYTRNERYYVSYKINDDRSHIESREWAVTVLKERAIEQMKQISISYSTSIQKAEVIEAYTRKADGRRIDVPKTNFQLEVNSGKDKNDPVFSDITRLTVVFPELTVGDTVVFSYQLIQIEPTFPGHISFIGFFPKRGAYDDLKIKIDLPTSLWVQYEARQMTETISEKDGRKIIEWTYQNKKPLKNKRRNYSVYDIEQEPGYAFSTFKSYAEIAEAYAARARPKAAVTERLQKLADEIVKDKKGTREQARALYEWVANNISYAGNCIGVGTVVPHDVAFILDNRMGDCKDHATLFQALLAAKGIESTQALVNASSNYKLPKIPVVSMVNHVINYIPSLNLFADATSEDIPFGMLPFSSADKPVLLMDGFKEGIKTPVQPIGSNQQRMRSKINVAADGSVKGDIELHFKGIFAVNMRSYFRHMPKDREEEFARNVFRNSGYLGNGTLDKEDPQELTDAYNFKVKFELKEFVPLPGAGAFRINPLFYSEAPIQSFLSGALEPEDPVDVVCTHGVSIEEYVYRFPKNMKILSIPKNSKITEGVLSYQATYKRDKNTLTVKRVIDDKTPGNVCSPDATSRYKKFATKVLQNVKLQVVYQ